MNWDQIRENFPAVKNQRYFFTAAVGPLHEKVHKAYVDHANMMFQTGDVHYEESVEKMEGTREKLAKLLGAQTEDMAFLTNTSQGMNLLAMMLSPKGGGEIIAPKDEFPSSTIPWAHHGFKMILLPSQDGQVSVNQILNTVTDKTVAVVTSAVQYSTGYRINLKNLGEELKKRNIPFVVNATQCLGLFPIDVKENNISALLASTHKWFGAGYGCSVCYMSPDFRGKYKFPVAGWLSVEEFEKMNSELTQLKSGTSVIEAGVPPFATLAGLDAACDVVQEIGVEKIAERVMELSTFAVDNLKSLPLKILSPRDNETHFKNSMNSGTLLLEVTNPEEVRAKLEEMNIFTTVRGPGLRVAIHYFNNKEDINTLINSLKEVL